MNGVAIPEKWLKSLDRFTERIVEMDRFRAPTMHARDYPQEDGHSTERGYFSGLGNGVVNEVGQMSDKSEPWWGIGAKTGVWAVSSNSDGLVSSTAGWDEWAYRCTPSGW